MARLLLNEVKRTAAPGFTCSGSGIVRRQATSPSANGSTLPPASSESCSLVPCANGIGICRKIPPSDRSADSTR
ncbi:MAG: hypothetical protein QM723_09565 [Myxococcaceae bacterium]